MPRQDLDSLKSMCKDYGKVSPKEWPEGLIGVGPDMRNFVKVQEVEAKAPVVKAPSKKPSAKKTE